MRGLLSDRFLRMFAGDLKHQRKHLASNVEEHNPQAEADSAVGAESHTAENDCDKEAAGGKNMPNAEELNKPGEIEPKKD